MDYEDVAWEKSEQAFEPLKAKVFETDILREVGRFIVKHKRGVPDQLFAPIKLLSPEEREGMGDFVERKLNAKAEN
ncbi:hypothetical protein BDV06DRAFT_227710 [Aspergillus oleicola]